MYTNTLQGQLAQLQLRVNGLTIDAKESIPQYPLKQQHTKSMTGITYPFFKGSRVFESTLKPVTKSMKREFVSSL